MKDKVKQQDRNRTILFLDRIKAIVEHAELTQEQWNSLATDINEVYSKHVERVTV